MRIDAGSSDGGDDDVDDDDNDNDDYALTSTRVTSMQVARAFTRATCYLLTKFTIRFHGTSQHRKG